MKYLKLFEEYISEETDKELVNLASPTYIDGGVEYILKSLGVSVTKSSGSESNVSVRILSKKDGEKTLYSFKIKNDFESFKSYIDSSSNYKGELPKWGVAEGARYPYQLIVSKR